MVICLEHGADLHMAQIDFTFLVPAHPGSPGKRAVKRVCACVGMRHYTILPEITYAERLAQHGSVWCGLLLPVYCSNLLLVGGGIAVSGVRSMNEVNACRAWLVLGWVTVFGRVYHLGM